MFTYFCKILNVVDGDTVDIELDLGFNIKMKERVRLIGLDTPEVFGPNAEPSGQLASTFTKTWLAERQSKNPAFIYESKRYNSKDKYGRSLGVILWVDPQGDRQSLNQAIIASGNVKHLP